MVESGADVDRDALIEALDTKIPVSIEEDNWDPAG